MRGERGPVEITSPGRSAPGTYGMRSSSSKRSSHPSFPGGPPAGEGTGEGRQPEHPRDLAGAEVLCRECPFLDQVPGEERESERHGKREPEERREEERVCRDQDQRLLNRVVVDVDAVGEVARPPEGVQVGDGEMRGVDGEVGDADHPGDGWVRRQGRETEQEEQRPGDGRPVGDPLPVKVEVCPDQEVEGEPDLRHPGVVEPVYPDQDVYDGKGGNGAPSPEEPGNPEEGDDPVHGDLDGYRPERAVDVGPRVLLEEAYRGSVLEERYGRKPRRGEESVKVLPRGKGRHQRTDNKERDENRRNKRRNDPEEPFPGEPER